MNMQQAKTSGKKILSISGNVLLVMFLLLMIFSPAAKGWVLKMVISVGFFRPDPESNPDLNRAPHVSLSLKSATDQIVNTDQFKGKTIFVNFWASWCPPCRAEMSSLNELYNTMKNDTSVVFLFVSEDEDQEKATQYLSANHYTLPLFTLAAPPPRTVYAGKLPTTIVINPNGKLVYQHEQMADYNTRAFKKYLSSL